MIKKYCDCCGIEIDGNNAYKDRLGAKIKKDLKTLKIEIITGKDNTWNDGDFCKYCVIDAVKKLDDRPREECAVSC